MVRSEERRRFYRANGPRSVDFDFVLRTADGEVHRGEVVDLCIGGASARFERPGAPYLDDGDLVEVAIGAASRDTRIRVDAKVVRLVERDDRGIQYAFDFLETDNLYGRLDSFYSRFFNRRRDVRVLGSLDRRITVDVEHEGETYVFQLQDLSISGIGLVIDAKRAPVLAYQARVGLDFDLPGKGRMDGHGWVRFLSRLPRRRVIGLEFDMTDAAGFGKHQRVLAEYVEERRAEVRAWESAWG